ncbi:MAG: hypothetical protein AAGA75_00010 [Cyanobacteria bacterium P01_E01_bin.6]
MTSPSADSSVQGTSQSQDGAKSLDCDLAYNKLSAMLSGTCKETTSLPPDSKLMVGDLSDLLDGIKVVTGELKIPYDQVNDSTYQFVVTEKGSAYLAGPSIVQHEDGAGIAWGDKVYPIDSNTQLMSGEWRLISTEKRSHFFYKPAQLKFPFTIRLSEEGRKSLYKDFVSLMTFGQLHKYLAPSGQGIGKFQELDNDIEFEILGVKEVRDTKDKTRQFAILTCSVDGEKLDFFAPGEANDWADTEMYPMTVTKKEGVIEFKTANGGEGEIELSGSYKKIHELEIGITYQVIAYSVDTASYDGRTWDSTLLEVKAPDGKVIRVNGNAQVLDSLTSQLSARNDGGERHEINATLTVDNVKQTVGKDGKTRHYPRFRFQIETAESKALMALLSSAA